MPLPEPFRHRDEPYYPFCPTDDKRQDQNRMTAQFQDATAGDGEGTSQIRVFNSSTRGVRVSQMVNAFLELYFKYVSSNPSFPFPKDHEPAVRKGVSTMIDFVYKVQRGGGTSDPGTIQTYQWDKNDKKGINAEKAASKKRIRITGDFRIEIENNVGYNLRDL
jgi:hypothetical protein